MNAIEYLKQCKRMCSHYERVIPICTGCPLFHQAPGCSELEGENPAEAVKIVEEWSAEHPEVGASKKEAPAVLKKGTPVWYVDTDIGEIEPGTVASVYYKAGKLESLGVDFEDGDFDEFFGSALGSCIFDSMEKAERALIGLL